MTLIVAPADGYDSIVSLADADTYCAAMGLVAWDGTNTAKEHALRRATQYLLTRYRVKAEFLDPVHTRVAAACCEAAVKAIAGALYADVDAKVVTSETVGPISVSYAANLRNSGQVRFVVLDDLLFGLTDGMMASIKLARA